jgi:hypothetical protein
MTEMSLAIDGMIKKLNSMAKKLNKYKEEAAHSKYVSLCYFSWNFFAGLFLRGFLLILSEIFFN